MKYKLFVFIGTMLIILNGDLVLGQAGKGKPKRLTINQLKQVTPCPVDPCESMTDRQQIEWLKSELSRQQRLSEVRNAMFVNRIKDLEFKQRKDSDTLAVHDVSLKRWQAFEQRFGELFSGNGPDTLNQRLTNLGESFNGLSPKVQIVTWIAILAILLAVSSLLWQLTNKRTKTPSVISDDTNRTEPLRIERVKAVRNA